MLPYIYMKVTKRLDKNTRIAEAFRYCFVRAVYALVITNSIYIQLGVRSTRG